MIKPTDFHRMWIAVPTVLQQALADGNVLTCSHEQVQFALTAAGGLTEAQEVQEVQARLAQDRPAYILPIGTGQLADLRDGHTVSVTVIDHDMADAGHIDLIAQGGPLRTEHGDAAVDVNVASTLRGGDFFAVCERNAWCDWVVYRAVGDYANGQVVGQRTSDPDGPTVPFTGDYQVVYRVTDLALTKRLARLLDTAEAVR